MTLTSIITNPRERSRFLRFAVVGIFGAVVDFGTFNILTSLVGLTAVVASIFSFLAAVVSNFTWNRYWTYPDSRSKPISRQLIQFTFVSLIGLAIRTPLIAVLNRLFIYVLSQTDLALNGVLSIRVIAGNLALAIAVIVVMFWNFFVNRYWTYSDVSP
jgi:putative flippase GtrA